MVISYRIEIQNHCSHDVDLYDNAKVEIIRQSGMTERFFEPGTSGMLRMGQDPDATLAEFSNAADGSFSCYDISTIPTGNVGPGKCNSYEDCRTITGGTGFNVPMKIIPSKTDGDTCKEIQCLGMDPMCKDAYAYPTDDIKTHTCKKGVDYQVIFCPLGSKPGPNLIQDLIRPILEIPLAPALDIIVATNVLAPTTQLTPPQASRSEHLRSSNQNRSQVVPPQIHTSTIISQTVKPPITHQQTRKTKLVTSELGQSSKPNRQIEIVPIAENVQEISTKSGQKSSHVSTIFIVFGILTAVACIAGAVIFYGRKKKQQLSQFYSKDESSARSRFSVDFTKGSTLNHSNIATEQSF